MSTSLSTSCNSFTDIYTIFLLTSGKGEIAFSHFARGKVKKVIFSTSISWFSYAFMLYIRYCCACSCVPLIK
ncbi:hypothetical protein EB796_017449 [Bugula neritina]|uniref:Uncharacterized protein n=1 Tax=Bugula neritina TaxID=10212 RepID=A0A7J7JF42_BUGNE|nr:hypothetical protein EB796_017449 [Bugula neritina]